MKAVLNLTDWRLAQDWRGDPAGTPDWLPAKVPGQVHDHLMAAGRLPDPFVGCDEDAVQWVGERDWVYRCEFDLPDEFAQADHVALGLDGLDTFATVTLNGQQVLVSDNMFVPHRLPVAHLLRPSGNELMITFESAWRHGLARQTRYGQRLAWATPEPSRVWVRKAQYHYGWDWGPRLITAGPWRPVTLEAYQVAITAVTSWAELAEHFDTATLTVRVELDSRSADQARDFLDVELRAPDGTLVAETSVPAVAGNSGNSVAAVAGNGCVLVRLAVHAPLLWWPRGLGDQPLYRLSVKVRRGDEVADRRDLRLGFRRLRLVQQPLPGQPGTSFHFEVNDTPVFCGGANWIPADSFTTRLTPDDYRELLTAAADANMVMVRVWGGGIYEDDVFYEICDELGLLVWQDFMFACGQYPAHGWFQASVRAEAEAVVRRLQHHACVALWCGNNEDYSVAHRAGLYDSTVTDGFTDSEFDGRELYERLLPQVCAELDPLRPYWPGSPYGGDDPDDPLSGDQHVWQVWHDPVLPYQEYPTVKARFVSEFGMQSLPHPHTIADYTTESERYAASRTMEHHNKGMGGPRRIAAYLADNLRTPATFADFIYSTQLVQAEAITAAIHGWRRQWQAGRRYVGGALIWQLDDCWPGTSWAIIDYGRRRKPAYYAARRALAPFVVGVVRAEDSTLDVWAGNATLTSIDVELRLRQWTVDDDDGDDDGDGDGPIEHPVYRHALPANASVDLRQVADAVPGSIVCASLEQNGHVLARHVLWPEPYKYLTFADPQIELSRMDQNTIRLSARRPAKGVWIDSPLPIAMDDNMLDLLPGMPQTVTGPGLGDADLSLAWLR